MCVFSIYYDSPMLLALKNKIFEFILQEYKRFSGYHISPDFNFKNSTT